MWSDKYIGLKYNFDGRTREEGINCLTLILLVFKEVFKYNPMFDDSLIKRDWHKEDPELMIKEAVKRGEVIKSVDELRANDIVFFTLEGDVRHMGIMVDNYNNFLHQLANYTSRLDKISKQVWKDKFFCGIRIKELHGQQSV